MKKEEEANKACSTELGNKQTSILTLLLETAKRPPPPNPPQLAWVPGGWSRPVR